MRRIAILAACLLALAAGRASAQVVCADASTPCISGQTYGKAITSTTAVQLLASDGSRKTLTIQNQPGSASAICVAMGVTASNAGGLCNGFVLNAGNPYFLANYTLGNSFGGIQTLSVSAIGMTGNANVGYSFSD